MSDYRIALAGNPNSGKTTLLNALTGTRHSVGNWPGVTVEKKIGHLKRDKMTVEITDLPGVYSLSPYTLEEKIARQFILEEKPDVVINLVDACNMERNLYLTLQLLELKIPVVIALNMMDEAERSGYAISVQHMEEALGVPVVPVAAIEGRGIDVLLERALETVGTSAPLTDAVHYGNDLEQMIRKLEREISHHGIHRNAPPRWLAIKALEHDEELGVLTDGTGDIYLKMENNYADEIANRKYMAIQKLLESVLMKPQKSAYQTSDRIDSIMLHPLLGIPIFLLIMAAVFKLTFDVGGVFVDLLDVFFSQTLSGAVTTVLESAGVGQWLVQLLVDGVIGGVGGVLSFTPNIAILFLAISLLEDSGYMARVAFLLDEGMQKLGLSGKAFIPMILGFGCNVPGIMATRTLENEKDRLIAILINPFMSCGARLPVYVLIASAFFPGYEAMVTFSLYLLGILVALMVSWAFRRIMMRGEETHFIMELPTYRVPKLKFLLLHVWERVEGYVVKAGTVIFAASVALWFVLNYNFQGPSLITESFGAMFGKATAPLFAPLGFGNWQISLSLFTGIVAKEIVVANMAIIYGVGSDPSAGAFYQALSGAFTPLTAYVLLVFVLLYTPCVGVIGVIRRETNSWKWTAFSVVFQFAVAWTVSFVFYRVGLLFFS